MNFRSRKSIRLKNYDYSQSGIYFITICTKDRECLFGKIENNNNGEKHCNLTDLGKIAYTEWERTTQIRKNVFLDEFIIMPNHIHGIIIIGEPSVGAYCNTPLQSRKFQSPSNNLGSIIRGYKSSVTKQINNLLNTPLQPIWQRNYYEHIVRSEKSLNKIREYILRNPSNWEKDELFKK